jgi:hypothetical protein
MTYHINGVNTTNMTILPMEIINYICLFNSHPVADTLRKDKANRERDRLCRVVINKLNLPEYILSYNKSIFDKRMKDMSISTLHDQNISFTEKYKKISHINCLIFVYKNKVDW